MAKFQDDVIIFKPTDTVAMCILAVLDSFGCGVLLILATDIFWWLAGIISLVMLGFCFLAMLSHHKTVIFTPNGCIIRFWFLKKEYRWNELQTKRYQNYAKCRDRISFRIFFTEKTFECSPHLYIKGKHIPLRYAEAHPFSYVIIFLADLSVKKPPALSNTTYLADLNEFQNKLIEWGVEVKFER